MDSKNFTSPFKPLYIAALFAALLLCGNANAQLNNMFTDTLNKVLASKANQYSLKGVSASVVFSDGSTWKQTEGFAGTQPLNPDMLFEMGSNTKTFTAAIILLLEEEGKLSIDDTIYKYLSPLKNVTNGITIKQLLTHTSGLYNYTAHPDFFDKINKTDPGVKWDIDTVLATYLGTKLAEPGATYLYCNTGFVLLGKIIEQVEGKPYNVVLHEKLLSKHQLNHIYLQGYDNFTEQRAETWLSNGEYFDQTFTSFLTAAWAAGGIVATAEDLALWAHKLYGGEVLSAASMAKMTTRLKIDNKTYPMGLSMFFTTFLGKQFWGHGGATLQNSEMEYSVSSKYSVVVVCNEQNTYNEALTIKQTIEKVLEATLPPLSAPKLEAAQVSIYPNPSNNVINISLDNNTQSNTVNVYTISGQLVQQYKVEGSSLQINKDDIGTGVFIVEVANEHTTSRQRIVLY
jgi:CubicO group peptidase (beta-lactamase class C family)